LVKDNQKLKVEKKKNNSFILLKNQTSFLSKENGTDNKENIRWCHYLFISYNLIIYHDNQYDILNYWKSASNTVSHHIADKLF
jgi:hypothetical protein